MLQKVDHAVIFLNTAVSISQYCIFIVRSNRLALISVTWGLGLWGAYMVFALKKQTVHHLITSLPLFWIIPELYQLMTNYQFTLFVLTWTQVFVGLLAYGFRWPSPWPNYFGYHEIMHLLTTTASISAILLQHDMLHSFDQQFCLFADSLSAMASAPETTYL
jgi:hemolysin III